MFKVFSFLNTSHLKEKIFFVLGGICNTLFSYLIYVFLYHFLDYRLSFSVAYASGIIFSYYFNVLFVFKTRISIKKFLSYPIVYVVQYFLSMILIEVLHRFFMVNLVFAPIVTTLILLPVTFLMSKNILTK